MIIPIILMSLLLSIGLDNIKVTSNNDHRRALYHLFEWY